MTEIIPVSADTLPDLSDCEQYTYLYILKNPEAVERLSIRQLAAATATSTTTVLRMVRKFGYRGYSDFKYEMRKRRRARDVFRTDRRIFDLSAFFEIVSATEAFETSLARAANVLSCSHEILFAGDTYGACAVETGIRLFNSGLCYAGWLDQDNLITTRRHGTCAVVIIGNCSPKEAEHLRMTLPVGLVPLILIWCGGCQVKLPADVIDGRIEHDITPASSLIPAIHILEELRKRVNRPA